jgi:hypothetical protein
MPVLCPTFLSLSGRVVIAIGRGPSAARKVRGPAGSGAPDEVAAEDLCPGAGEAGPEGR